VRNITNACWLVKTLFPASIERFKGTIVLAFQSGYYLDGKKATLISMADDIRILAYVKAKGR
jgi:hypothetical protein